MAYVRSAKIWVYNTRPVRRTIGETSRTDVFALCSLQTDALPEGDELPTVGELIDGLGAGVIVDTGSTMKVLSSSETYVMGQDLAWHKTGGCSG